MQNNNLRKTMEFGAVSTQTVSHFETTIQGIIPADVLAEHTVKIVRSNQDTARKTVSDITQKLAVVRTRKDAAQLLGDRGTVLENALKEPTAAKTDYLRSLKCDPYCDSALHGLARIYRENKEFVKLACVLQWQLKKTTLQSEKIRLLLELGLVHELYLENTASAAPYFEQAISLDPENKIAAQFVVRKREQ